MNISTPKFFFIIAIVFSSFLTSNAQEFNSLTNGSDEAPIYQAVPQKEKLFSDAEIGNAVQTLSNIAQPDKENYGFIFVHVVPDDFQLIISFDLKIGTKKKVKKCWLRSYCSGSNDLISSASSIPIF